MLEHLFLCGLDAAQRKQFADSQILSLDKATGNLKLKLDQMRQTLAGNESERLTDFLEIASYVFAADRTTSRGSAILKNMGEEWRRSLHLIIGVRDPSFWNRQDVKQALVGTLAFLSEDNWRLDFETSRHPRALHGYFNFQMHDADAAGGTSIVLFSAGLDSLAGAVHELNTTKRHVVLVSHRNLPIVGARQEILAKQLAEDFPKRVTHVFVDNSLTHQLDDREETQRTRSFFFTAIAAVAAHIETSDRIRFYENGVMSVNLPIATQVVGARSSRSTHPRSLELLQNVVGLVSAHPINVDNPFFWKTKAEVVRELRASKQAPLIQKSLSCSRSRTSNKSFQPHCGKCVQCLHRRISTLGGGAADFDEAEGYETDFLIGPREDGTDRVMALNSVTLALDCCTMNDQEFFGRFADEFGRVLQAYPTTELAAASKALLDLFRRHGKTVFEIVSQAVKSKSDDIAGRLLPPSSLLAILLASNLARPRISTINEVDSLPDRPPDVSRRQVDQTTSKIYLTIDDQNRIARIWGGAVLSGDAIFPIMKRLAELRSQDRMLGLAPKNYQGLLAKQLGDENAVRSAVRRARNECREASKLLDDWEITDDDIVQNISGKGYRLNPNIEILTMEEFDNL